MSYSFFVFFTKEKRKWYLTIDDSNTDDLEDVHGLPTLLTKDTKTDIYTYRPSRTIYYVNIGKINTDDFWRINNFIQETADFDTLKEWTSAVRMYKSSIYKEFEKDMLRRISNLGEMELFK